MPRATFKRRSTSRGMTFVDVVVAAALLTLVFSGIVGTVQLTIKLIGHARAESGAVALANERIEYLRSLPYSDVGTVGGIPAGAVSQSETVALNGITYTRRTLVQYVDAPQDGSGASDENSITTDFKRAKVELLWTTRGEEKTLSLVTTIIPRGMETLAGGGTLVVNVFDAEALPVANAEVRVVNTNTDPAIDVSVFTNASGTAAFPGAPAAGGYAVSATKPGYSSDQTYGASTENPNPNPPHVAVIEGETSTANLAIDRVGSLTVSAVEPPTLVTDEDTFDDASGLSSMSGALVQGGALSLATTSGGFVAEGTAETLTTAPSYLLSWEEVAWSAAVPPQTELFIRVYSVDGEGVLSIVPDLVLPGNNGGFTGSPIDLAALEASVYPRLALRATLSSIDGSATPEVEDMSIAYMESDTPIPDVTATVSGTKYIGADGAGVPIRKYQAMHTTDGAGTFSIGDVEWDLYSISISGDDEGYDIADACPNVPVPVAPGADVSNTLVLVPHTPHSLLVYVTGTGGAPLSGATVELSQGGAPESATTSACGYAHFPDLSAADNYTIDVSASGHIDATQSDVTVNGTTVSTMTLTES